MTTTNPSSVVWLSPAGLVPRWPVGLFALLGASVFLLFLADGDVVRILVGLAFAVASTAIAAIVWAGGRRVGGIAAMAFGAIGLVVGIGIGLRWLASGALSWKSVLATVAFIPGLGLTALGLSRVTKGMTHLARWVTGVPSLLGVLALVWTFTPAVIASSVPPSQATMPVALGPSGRQVDFTTADGVRLSGWYVPPLEGKVAIVRHGSGSTSSDVSRQAAVLARSGYGVLLTDARGHGHSQGTAMDFGWYGESDIEAAIDFLVLQPEVDSSRIAIVGMSMGGEEAIGAAGSDDRIAAVVAEGATARTDADKNWLIDEYGWRGWIQVRLEWLQYSLADLLTGASKPRPLATAAGLADPTPILMITGGEVPDEGGAAAYVQQASPGNVSVWTVPGAGHIEGLATDPAQWEQTVVDFLDEALDDH
jgi:fermentation-respiration switch protein FrsA (DUF1100 family)